MNEIEFILDGRKVSAAPGETILEVARRNNIYIPTLCRDEKVSKTTSCFVCVVRDSKSGRFLPSCSACPAPGQEIDASGAEVKDMRRTALELLLSEHAGDCEAPCTMACPAHAEVEEYVRAGKNGDFKKALEIIKRRIPMPMSVGRVCPRFCEKNCRKNIFGEPVAINEFKRLAADLYYDEYMEELPPFNGKKVAVVGAGPAGLSSAYYLRLQGYAVTVFEAMDKAGGMTRYGIPEYRLPKATLDREIAHFVKMGIEFKYNTRLGGNLSMAELEKDFDAIAIAIGCWKPSGLHCEGEELAKQGIDFLREVVLSGNKLANPGKVIVVGGGNTAMDCLRSSVRLGGSPVSCFYRRTEAEMPAEKLEIEEAREEGVEFTFLVAPVKLEKRNGKLVLTCRRMELGEPDASGRRKPVEIPGSEFETEADTVIGAIGQKTAAPEGVKTNKFGYLDAPQGSTHVEGKVFAAGDCLSGAATVVEALAGGHRLAMEVDTFITGTPHPEEHTVFVSRGKKWQGMTEKDVVILKPEISNAPRQELKMIPLEERKTTFKETTVTMTAEQLAEEGKRCIECSCTDKHDCKLRFHSEKCGAKADAICGEKLPASFDNRHPVIIQDRSKCIKCGICVKVCKEIVNKTLLSAKNRGFFTYTAAVMDQTLPDSCADCGLCVEHCPVGALDWKNKK